MEPDKSRQGAHALVRCAGASALQRCKGKALAAWSEQSSQLHRPVHTATCTCSKSMLAGAAPTCSSRSGMMPWASIDTGMACTPLGCAKLSAGQRAGRVDWPARSCSAGKT